jgi:hypothetical protein
VAVLSVAVHAQQRSAVVLGVRGQC